MTPIDENERVFSLGDLAALFKKQKKRMIQAALIGMTLGTFYCLAKPVRFEAVATFKEGSGKSSGGEGLLSVLGNFGDSSPQTMVLMQSNVVLKPLASQFGFQIQPECAPKWARALRRLRENIRIIRGLPIEDTDAFRFSNVHYEKEKEKSFNLCFETPETFTVQGGKVPIKGRIGDTILLDEEVSFKILHAPKNILLNRPYRFSISSWVGAVENLRNCFKICTHKTNKSIYSLSFSHRDRHFATEILNALMVHYQNYLKTDHDQVAEAQIDYLVKRQNNIYGMLEEIVDEHANYLRDNLNQGGFLSLKDEIKIFLEPHSRLSNAAFETELNLDALENEGVGGSDNDLLSKGIEESKKRIRDLEGKRDFLQSSLCFRAGERPVEKDFEPTKHELAAVRADLAKTKQALCAMEETGALPMDLNLSYDPNRIVQRWAQSLEEEGGDLEGGDFALYLRNLVRLFSVREKVLQEHPLQDHKFPELEGIDLLTADGLLVSTSQNLDSVNAMIETCCHFSNKLSDPAFEISSLSAIFSDPVSKKLLENAVNLHFALRDEESHSIKEEERYRREMELQRNILAQHLQQMREVHELNAYILQEKIAALQQIKLDAISREISVSQERVEELVDLQKKNLRLHKNFTDRKLAEMRSRMSATIPEKWRKEHLMQFKAEMGAKMMRSIGQLVESKTIGHHLHQVESKPIDTAFPPLEPRSVSIHLFAVAGAFLGAFGTFATSFFRAFYRGFPAASDTLRSLRYPYSGSISFATDGPGVDLVCDTDLEVLRKWMLLVDQEPRGKLLALLGSSGPDYSWSLASMLTQSGRKALLIRCDFPASFPEKDVPGLLQVLRGFSGALPIRRENGFDVLPSGGYTRYGTELMRSHLFRELIDKLRGAYDHILLYSRAPLDNSQCEALIRICDKAAVTITDQPIESLTPFVRWAYHEGRTRLTFFTTSRSP